MLKKPILLPFYKKVDKQILRNYRAAAQLPVYGKLFEKIVFNEMFKLFVTIGPIQFNQSGLKPGNSCIMTCSVAYSEPWKCLRWSLFRK